MADISQIDSKFLHSYSEFSSQNSLMALLAGDMRKIAFIFRIAKEAFESLKTHLSRFEPNPLNYFPEIYKGEKSNDIIVENDIKRFFNVVDNINDFFQLIRNGVTSASTTDSVLIDYLCRNVDNGMKFIKILYFFIFTNSIAFGSVNLEGVSKNMTLFKISHSEDKEAEFYSIKGERKILFHGTSFANLYSIMRNGIKTMSGGKYQSNGAAYGSGIYLTDNFSTAAGYGSSDVSARGHIFGKPKEGTTISNTCVLVFDCKKLNKQGGGFCFVQQENEIILRCIYVVDRSINITDPNIVESLNAYAISQSNIYRPREIYDLSKAMASIKINPEELDLLTIENFGSNEPKNGSRVIQLPRFNKEIDRLFDLVKAGDSTIIKANFLVPSDRQSPLLFLLSPDKDTDLYKDFIKYRIPGIKVAVYFPSSSNASNEYPNVPPKIRVISPILIDGTGRVTKGGSLCADILYPEGWSPANRIESILRNLIISIATEGARNGPGRVDFNRLNKEYKYNDYVNSFSEAAGYHGYTAI